MRMMDFSSWNSILTTLFGLALVTIIGVGVRLLAMVTIQQRRERVNRQINERLKTLIAAYKVLGGSMTGDLSVDGRHLRDVRRAARPEAIEGEGNTAANDDLTFAEGPAGDRARRTRDAVEGALSDIFLLGTEEHVRLASQVARDLVAGARVNTDALVIALRAFIRDALDLDPIPADLDLPRQGPTRPSSSAGGRGGREGSGGRGGGGGGAAAAGGGEGAGLGMAAQRPASVADDLDPPPGAAS